MKTLKTPILRASDRVASPSLRFVGSRRDKRMIHWFAALTLVLLNSVLITSSSAAPLAGSNLRIYGAPVALSHASTHVYPPISSGSSYLADAGAVKRSAHIIFTDGQRASVPRADFLQSLDDHVYPWGTGQGLLAIQAAAEAALARTLFFDDYPHERALASYISIRREQELPDIRLGSIRFSSPFLLSL